MKKKKIPLLIGFCALILVLLFLSILGIMKIKQYRLQTASSPIHNLDSVFSNNSINFSDPEDPATLVCLGNSPFADDRASTDNLSTLIGEQLNANVYNLSIPNTYASSYNETFRPDYPYDAFSLYWLAAAFCVDNMSIYDLAFDNMATVPSVITEVLDTIQSIDFNTVDAILIMYDGSDYLASRTLNNPENSSDIQTFYGALNAGIQLIQTVYPNIPIYLASPAYAYSPDENGEYQNSNVFQYGEGYLFDYVHLASNIAYFNQVTFIDTYHITEVNKDYFSDYIHLSKEGRIAVAEHIANVILNSVN